MQFQLHSFALAGTATYLRWLRVLAFNPLSACSANRLEDFEFFIRSFNISVFIGTQLRAAPDGEVTKNKVGKGVLVQSGWLPSPYVTKAAGITFLLGAGLSEKKYSRAADPSSTRTTG